MSIFIGILIVFLAALLIMNVRVVPQAQVFVI